ncbi:MAG: transmembrane sensor [Halioglobus sp.]|jgi:transmembrane sensor
MQESQLDTTESYHDTALGWIARFRSGSASAEDHQEFALWLAQDSSHKQMMDSMLDMWADLASVQQLYSDTPDTTTQPAVNDNNWFKGAIGAAAALMLALFFWPASQQPIAQSLYQTALGEQQTIELEDGSTLTLNTNSQVAVSFDEKHRALKLIKGEAFFKVAKDPERPFKVNAGSAQVTAIGTAFNIYRNNGTSNITVVEGVVKVTELGSTPNRTPQTEILRANQKLKVTTTGLQAATKADVSQQTAWQHGELIARNMPLVELITQIERYHDIHILVSDASIATLSVSGVFILSELDPILQALQISLDLQTIPVGSNSIALTRSPEPT